MPKAQGKIERVVVLMSEKRSFDHVLGLSKGLHRPLGARDRRGREAAEDREGRREGPRSGELTGALRRNSERAPSPRGRAAL